ncbi:MAG: hypothetical protein ACK5MD_10430 [Flavobacteriales bacterium]
MKTHLTILFFIWFSNLALSQAFKPLEIVRKVFTDRTFQNEILKNTKLDFKMLDKNKETAVINLTLTDSLGKGIDTYVHLRNENGWKINAFRALAMTGMLEQIKNQFENMTDKQIDSMIATGDEDIKSKEDFYYNLKNIKLTLELDDNIIKHFNDNKKAFEDLRQKIVSLKSKGKDDLNVILKEDLRKLYLGNLMSRELLCDECIVLTIGGMIDNTVGYFYLNDQSKLPKMNPAWIIMIREIGGGWYLFKTT